MTQSEAHPSDSREEPRRPIDVESEGSGESSKARESSPPTDRDASASGESTGDGEGRKKGRWKKRLGVVLLAIPLLGVGSWYAVHHIPGVGPWVANTLRALFGNEFVAWLEDTVYGVEDWVNRKTKADEPPEAMWEVPAPATTAEAEQAEQANTAPSEPDAPPPFSLENVGPMYENMATEGDGVWTPLVDPRHPEDRVRALKTYLHPDKSRSWAAVAVVAVDLSQVDLHLVAGKHEPENKTPEAKEYERPAVIPEAHHEALIAAFNGGYKATHGDYGMKVDGVTLVPMRRLACTISKTKDGEIRIDPHEEAKKYTGEIEWFRQTPVCMYHEGEPHPALSMPSVGWGASHVSKTTVIRRSAMGLREDGEVLFVGIGDHVTGKAIAEAMVHAGSHDVAQLDVNFSYPKFLTYERGEEGELKAVPISDEFEFEPQQYVGSRARRDFFYLTRPEDS